MRLSIYIFICVNIVYIHMYDSVFIRMLENIIMLMIYKNESILYYYKYILMMIYLNLLCWTISYVNVVLNILDYPISKQYTGYDERLQKFLRWICIIYCYCYYPSIIITTKHHHPLLQSLLQPLPFTTSLFKIIFSNQASEIRDITAKALDPEITRLQMLHEKGDDVNQFDDDDNDDKRW